MKTTLLCLLMLLSRTSALSRAVLSVLPDRSQFFEYESVSLSCGQVGSSDWTVWRYTLKSLELSPCGSGWGSRSWSSCRLETVKLSSSGVYWCQSTEGRSSNTVNISVTGGRLVLHSTPLPVAEGSDVTLTCATASSAPPARFYRNEVLIGAEPTGRTTLRNFSTSSEGAYRCEADGLGASAPSWLLTPGDPEPVLLSVSPDSAQLREYGDVALSCGTPGHGTPGPGTPGPGWSLRRFTRLGRKLSSCGDQWGANESSRCLIHTAKTTDSGLYWCESPAGRRSNTVNISVYDAAVILQSPVLPVMEGHDVSLHCETKTRPPPDPTAAFYKDGSLIRTEPTGHMTIRHVSKSDEGLYRCVMREGESPPSWLFVEGEGGASGRAHPTLMMRYLVVFLPYFLSTVLMVSTYRQRSPDRTPPSAEEEEEGAEPQYEDVAADVTTQHHF